MPRLQDASIPDEALQCAFCPALVWYTRAGRLLDFETDRPHRCVEGTISPRAATLAPAWEGRAMPRLPRP